MKKYLLIATNPGSIRAWMPLCAEFRKIHNSSLKIYISPYFTKEWESLDIPFFELNTETIHHFERDLSECDVLLSGTSVQGTPFWEWEHRARIFASKHTLPSLTLVDHWSNSMHRFSFEQPWDSLWGKVALPHQDALGSYPQGKAEYLPLGNPHWEWLLSQVPEQRLNCEEILFVSEPLRTDSCSQSLAYDQYSAFEMARNYAQSLGMGIQVKLHPRENPNTWIERFGTVSFFQENPCTSPLKFNTYIGMTSMLLIELYISGHPVISFQPTAESLFERMPFGLNVCKDLKDQVPELIHSKFQMKMIVSNLFEEILSL